MKAVLRLTAVLLGLAPVSLAGQESVSLGIGVHSEGGLVRPGAQAILSTTRTTRLDWVHLRGELYGSLSKPWNPRPFGVASDADDGLRTILGVGAGVQLERRAEGTRPYLYVTPTASYLSENRWGGGFDLGLAGGVGVTHTVADRDWFAELSWRGHGDKQVDETALGALTVGIRF